jgi:two-component system sensor histidine kinase DesK
MLKLFSVPKEFGMLPYVWLAFLGFYVLPLSWENFSPLTLLIAFIGLLIFLPIYFAGFAVEKDPAALRSAIGLTLLAAIVSIQYPAATTFFHYAAFFFGFALKPAKAILALAAILAIAAGLVQWADLHSNNWYVTAIVSTGLLGIGLYVRQQHLADAAARTSEQEIQHLAKIAERERIARDLHDVMGHTLSVITLKAQLARKLMRSDPQRSVAELKEIEELSRGSMADVRATVGGYQQLDLQQELTQVLASLELSNIKGSANFDGVAPPEKLATLVSMIVREGVTNVIRHSNASACEIDIHSNGEHLQLDIRDDGVGIGQLPGNGLRGIQERVGLLEGEFSILADRGTRLHVLIPLHPT